MKILKHGNTDIVNEYTTTFTCSRCGCEFLALESELTAATESGDPLDLFVKLLTNPNLKETKLYDTINCPECGQLCKHEKNKVE